MSLSVSNNIASPELQRMSHANKKQPERLGSSTNKTTLVALAIFAGIGGALLGAGVGGLAFAGATVVIIIGAAVGASLGIGVALLAIKVSKAVINYFYKNTIRINNILATQPEKTNHVLPTEEDLNTAINQSQEQVHQPASLSNHRRPNMRIAVDAFDTTGSDADNGVQADPLVNMFLVNNQASIETKTLPLSEKNYNCLKKNNEINTGITMLPFKPSGASKSQSEDGFSQLINNKFSLTTVIDGHNGAETTKYLEDNLLKVIEKELNQVLEVEENPSNEQIAAALSRSFSICNANYFQSIAKAKTSTEFDDKMKSGAAACVVLQMNGAVWTATAGDCRAILVSEDPDMPVQLSVDCDTDDIKSTFLSNDNISNEELEKVNKGELIVPLLGLNKTPLGYIYTEKGDKGQLAPSKTNECLRAFGDLTFPGVTAQPKITTTLVQDKNAKIVLVSDGVTKSASSEQVSQFASAMTQEGKTNAEIAQAIAYKCRNVTSATDSNKYPNTDDITCAVFDLFNR